MNSILMESLSPTQEREPRPLKGGKLYESITNRDGNQFPTIISYYMTGPDTFCHEYSVIGEHGIPTRYLDEMIEELIQKAI